MAAIDGGTSHQHIFDGHIYTGVQHRVKHAVCMYLVVLPGTRLCQNIYICLCSPILKSLSDKFNKFVTLVAGAILVWCKKSLFCN